MELIKHIFNFWRALVQTHEIKSSRNFTDFLTDRLIQVSTEGNLLSATEKLGKLLQSNFQYISSKIITNFLTNATKENSEHILTWVRQYPEITSMILTQKTDEDFEACLVVLKDIQQIKTKPSKIAFTPSYDLEIKVKCLSPLAHGGDAKAGNATIFRRMQILSETGDILQMPFYAGNAFRGKLRDLLAEHFLKSLDLLNPATAHTSEKENYDKPYQLEMWFFHTIFAGGCLEENSKQAKNFAKYLGSSGATKGEGIAQFRQLLPNLSLLGSALGNRVIEGKINVGDLRPVSYEWGNGTKPVCELFDWLFLTRREDNEGHEDGENASMIANTEVLKAGTELIGGVDLRVRRMSKVEQSCLALGLKLFQEKGQLGAETRRGLGKVNIEYNLNTDEINLDPQPYLDFLEKEKDTIIAYLLALGAISERKEKETKETEEKPEGKEKKDKKEAKETAVETTNETPDLFGDSD